MARSEIVDEELLGVLCQTGECAYRFAQLLARGGPRDRGGLTRSEFLRVTRLIRSCVDRVLPALADGTRPRLSLDEQETLAHLGHWARHDSSRPVRAKLRAFARGVRRLEVRGMNRGSERLTGKVADGYPRSSTATNGARHTG